MTLKIRAREEIQERKAGWVWVGGGWARKEEKQEQAKEVGCEHLWDFDGNC